MKQMNLVRELNNQFSVHINASDADVPNHAADVILHFCCNAYLSNVECCTRTKSSE